MIALITSLGIPDVDSLRLSGVFFACSAEEYAVLCFDPMISREYIYFDFSSLPMHKVAIETTRDTNEMVFSAPSRARGWAKFVAWRAVYTNGIDIQNATVEERRAACRGYVGSVSACVL